MARHGSQHLASASTSASSHDHQQFTPPPASTQDDGADTSDAGLLGFLPADADGETTDLTQAPSYDTLLADWRARQAEAPAVSAPAPKSAPILTAAAAAAALAPPANPAPTQAAAATTSAPDPYAEDDLVTVLLPRIYRAVLNGTERKPHRVFIPTEGPRREVDDGQGGVRFAPGQTYTTMFLNGVARHVRYGVARSLKRGFAHRQDDVLKIIADETPETQFARLCGVQPPQPQKQAALLLASDLDAVLAEFSTEQLATFAAALQRRAAAAQGVTPGVTPGANGN